MISQEAFDEMVHDNMEDFEMTKEEALSETIKQLTSMGRDLSSIDTTGGQEREQILSAVGILKDYKVREAGEVNGALQVIDGLCSDKYEYGRRNQNILKVNGGVGHMIIAIDSSISPDIIITLLDVLSNISRSNGNLRIGCCTAL